MGVIKRSVAAAAALVLALGLVACGNNDGGATPTPEQTTPQQTETPEATSPVASPGVSASQQPTDEPTAPAASGGAVKYGVLNGPTGLGAIGLHKESAAGNTANTYEFVFAGAPDEMVGKITSGEVDIAAVPTNLASTLYNKTNGDIVQLSNITLGVLYIMENGNTINSIEDLKGKTIYATGQGSNPEYVLNYVLEQAGIADDVTIEFKSEHSELATLMAAGDVDIALLPEPFVTSTTTQNADVRIALSMNEEWQKANEQAGIMDSQLVMSSVVAKKEYVESNPELVAAFMADYEASVKYVNENAKEAAEYMEQAGILGMKAAVAEKAIPNCAMVFITGDDMKAMTGNFLSVLHKANPQAVGGALPGDDFYYAQ